jgi:hypothetical protein
LEAAFPPRESILSAVVLLLICVFIGQCHRIRPHRFWHTSNMMVLKACQTQTATLTSRLVGIGMAWHGIPRGVDKKIVRMT